MDEARIRPIVICLFRRDDRILVSEAYDTSAGRYFCRPLGGGIEFGERSREALLREIREEVGAEVENLELVGVLENVFTYEGARGHEIVFVYDGEFKDKRMYVGDEVQGYRAETDAGFVAKWRSPEEISGMNARLVPEGLAALLSREIK